MGSKSGLFTSDYDEVRLKEDKSVLSMLQMTLKACVLANEAYAAQIVIEWAKAHTYLISVDEETVWYGVF